MSIRDKIHCVHRHDMYSHPACFARGDVCQEHADAIEKEYGMPWWKIPGMKIGYLDIETDNLKADFGTMLSWAIKEKDGGVHLGVIDKEQLFFSYEPDKKLVSDLILELLDYQIICTYYGTGFDIPFVRAKALHYDLLFPSYGDIYHYDIYYQVKSKLCISSKSLANATDYLNIPGKTPIDKEVWRRAKYGDSLALAEVVVHNVADVEILEKLHQKLEPFAKWTRKSL